ncbi:MAG: hypothetical protein A2682_00590 [Candidatus Terrybacteria bacterium RIFCSPHIGHO2_01_FULL_58_15]|nr:MAG: hypothetical protein A2682_00590 [Candidatus Terrybacteria bacterium RIFCSPHIGHO2_01_FULL_58_15]
MFALRFGDDALRADMAGNAAGTRVSHPATFMAFTRTSMRTRPSEHSRSPFAVVVLTTVYDKSLTGQ